METNKLILILISATLFTGSVFGQSIKKCDIGVLGHVSVNRDKLNESDIKDFLLTFDKSCANNAEYSEFSNELLFMLLNKYTQTVVAVIEREKNRLATEYILNEIGSPINDSFDLKDLIVKVDHVKVDGKLKGRVIEKLKEALAKY